jgi:hypothetical protein
MLTQEEKKEASTLTFYLLVHVVDSKVADLLKVLETFVDEI